MEESGTLTLEAPASVQSGISRLGEWAQELVVRNADDYQSAVSTLKDVKRVRAEIVAFWREPKTKANEAWKSIVAKEKAMTDRCDAIERDAKAAMMEWQRVEQEKARKEQERLQREADERARRQREAQEAQARKQREIEEAARRKAEEARAAAEKASAEERARLLREAEASDRKAAAAADKAAIREENAENVQAVTPVVAPAVPKVAGASVQKRWTVKSVDKAALVRAAAADANLLSYLEVDESALVKVATALKGQVAIPGVTFEQTETMRIGGR